MLSGCLMSDSDYGKSHSHLGQTHFVTMRLEGHTQQLPARSTRRYEEVYPQMRLQRSAAIEDKATGQLIHRLHREVLESVRFGLMITYAHQPCRSNVFPEPIFPHISESSPGGKRTLRSTSTNFLRGVDAADDEALPLCCVGHVMVAEFNAMVMSCSPRGGTGETSANPRYFSIRRADTKL